MVDTSLLDDVRGCCGVLSVSYARCWMSSQSHTALRVTAELEETGALSLWDIMMRPPKRALSAHIPAVGAAAGPAAVGAAEPAAVGAAEPAAEPAAVGSAAPDGVIVRRRR